MPEQKTLRIKAVNVRTTSRGDIFEVVGDDGIEYATFQREIASQAQGLIGQLVNLSFVTKQKGQYTNHFCEGVTPAQAALPIEDGFTRVEATGPSPDKELRIMRQAATKVAVLLLPYLPANEQTPQGLLTMADFLVDYFVEGVAGAQPQAFAGDPGPEPKPLPADDDIPFLPTIDGFS